MRNPFLLLGCLVFLGSVVKGREPIDTEHSLEVAQIGDPVFIPEQPEIEPAGTAMSATASGGLAFYDHGNPTELEQLMLELVNRARANPGAEAARLGINLNDGLSPGEITDTPKQPLGSHRALVISAQGHSQWMLDYNVFSHTGADESTPTSRALAAGYPSGVGENIAMRFTQGPIEPEADTRERHEGLFISPGHRKNICLDSYREIGLGIRVGQFLSDGINYNAISVTQNFGMSSLTPYPFLVGVAYYDFNGNGFYDLGESIRGIEVNVADGTHYTTTASAGGFTLPRPSAAGLRHVSFSDGISEQNYAINMAPGVNHKVDMVLQYTPPVLSGPAYPTVEQSNLYTISPVMGATHVDVTAFTAMAAPFDGANNLTRVMDGTSHTYSAISTTVKYEGSGAYRFTHPEYRDETLEYETEFHVHPNASIHFRSRLRLATTYQIAHLEVSDDGGMVWKSVYSQAGTGTSGEASFQARTASLAAYSGKVIRIRFRYEVGISYYRDDLDHIGWFVDAVQFDNIDVLSAFDEKTVFPGSAYSLIPPVAGMSLLVARPRNFDRIWPPCPPLPVESAVAGYSSWAYSWEMIGGLTPGALSEHPMGDYNGDGVANLLAYGLGLDPLASDPEQLPNMRPHLESMIYQYTVDTAAVGIVVAPELSIDLTHWHPPGSPMLGFASQDMAISLEGTVLTRGVVFSDDLPTKVFARVGVRQNP